MSVRAQMLSRGSQQSGISPASRVRRRVAQPQRWSSRSDQSAFKSNFIQLMSRVTQMRSQPRDGSSVFESAHTGTHGADTQATAVQREQSDSHVFKSSGDTAQSVRKSGSENDTSHTKQCARHLLQDTHMKWRHQKRRWPSHP